MQTNNLKIYPMSYRYTMNGFNLAVDNKVLPLTYRYKQRGFNHVNIDNTEIKNRKK